MNLRYTTGSTQKLVFQPKSHHLNHHPLPGNKIVKEDIKEEGGEREGGGGGEKKEEREMTVSL